MSRSIRILVVDDHPIVRAGMASLIAIQPDMEVVGQAADGEEAVAKARALQPDVVVLDLLMPRKDGIQAAAEILEALPDTRILVLTNFAENQHIFPAIEAGVMGYLLKDSSPEELLEAIRSVHQGRPSLNHRVTAP